MKYITVKLQSGNDAVYACATQSAIDNPIWYGEQLAHELNGEWFNAGSFSPASDKILELVSLAE